MILGEVPELIKDYPNFYYYNFRGFYNKEEYKDTIHPHDKTGAPKAALRLFQVIGKRGCGDSGRF